jgi:hypothetical protein
MLSREADERCLDLSVIELIDETMQSLARGHALNRNRQRVRYMSRSPAARPAPAGAASGCHGGGRALGWRALSPAPHRTARRRPPKDDRPMTATREHTT